ncbi:3'(2'),5'-bisphosphate nucleotidase CysQ [Tuberibacillus sp. Marseille-P3662]|uniref:3'(2'),5'-bisphosphate nucleotidase CysQ n=1 Tax=Tuberibacillus sp. Marseille-P3662 TaxID=1965358 RepID=UPI000A1CB8D4|nr:3'(2'),5'-bisphosphate nucleotidase CysQ [Tuberibacillus sp. Marseille-P3662]
MSHELERLDTIDVSLVAQIAIQAGQAILDVYHSDDFNVETKADESPLTLADRKSHQMIVSQLEMSFSDIPILSEEGHDMTYDERSSWQQFWLVDPLDGTKEFIKKNDEFTVNIALIDHDTPVLGVIYAPALDILYVAKKGYGAYKVEQISDARDERLVSETDIATNGTPLPNATERDAVKVVASRSHMSPETEAFINDLEQEYDTVEMTSAGSSLKLCLVAEGEADYYPRYAPTMEWDTGAGHAIVAISGGTVLRTDNDEPLMYNKEHLKNPWFLAKR